MDAKCKILGKKAMKDKFKDIILPFSSQPKEQKLILPKLTKIK